MKRYIICVAYNKDHRLHGHKKFISNEQLDWAINVYMPNYKCVCRDYFLLENNSNRVKFSKDKWKNERYLLKVRYNITCSSPIKV